MNRIDIPSQENKNSYPLLNEVKVVNFSIIYKIEEECVRIYFRSAH